MKMSKGMAIGLGAIAVAIVAGWGMYIAQATSAYNVYTIKSKFAEAVVEADLIRLDVAEYYINSDNKWPSSLQDAGGDVYLKNLPTKVVQSVALGGEGVITVTFRAEVPELGGKSVVFTPAVDSKGEITWACSAPDIPAKYRTSNCP
jgi:hypothetical protein